MKKGITAILSLLICSVATVVLATTSFTARLESNVTTLEPGTEVELSLKLENFTEGEAGISVLLATIDYDRAVFEKITEKDLTLGSNWGSILYNEENGKLLLDSYVPVDTSHEAVKIKLKVREDMSSKGNMQIAIKEINASDGLKDIYTDDATITFEYNNIEANKLTILILSVLGIIILASVLIVAFKRKKNVNK